ncbi:glycoside hydrolase family 16 protein [Actinomycetospora lutea]|uniref:glycoside hydrolase family 16 protein n=1 Tax=Actinomycetospora lutea TaxID=663604 RepID=UPI00236721C1|nr:glycoside hydrolase family 16 protein [Actinomycetospora lutea]MDD7941455.1 glycoside hydrolase family 16 protein [Actinomycetospora lutea]
MNALLALVLVAAVSGCGVEPAPPPAYTFVDEFDGPAGAAPDGSRWTFDLGAGGWGNGELQTYTGSRENSFLDGSGHLVLRATRTVVARAGSPEEVAFRSARITTRDRFAQRYGHWEARLRIESRRGVWPAWWMLGDNHATEGWPLSGEIDVVEDYGFSAVESSVHTGTSPSALVSWSGGTGNDAGFHTFRMDWSPEGVSFARDGVPYAALAWAPGDPRIPTDPARPMSMLLNLAVGGAIGVPPPETEFPVDLVVDYVRVWS